MSEKDKLTQIRENVARAVRDRRSDFFDGQPDERDYATADRILDQTLASLAEIASNAFKTTQEGNLDAYACSWLMARRRALAEFAKEV